MKNNFTLTRFTTRVISFSKIIRQTGYHLAFIAVCIVCNTGLYAAKVDTALTYSASMNKNIKAVVITPDKYTTKTVYNVVYLLHGYSGNYADWVKIVPAIKALSDQYNLMIVCPDGNYGSWYFDSPIDSTWRYETYISKELVSYIDDHYSTNKSRTGRAITGLSMGGHGAFYLAFRHQEIFGAAGSMSGGVDIRPFPLNWDLSNRLGTYKEHPENWEKNTDINLVYLLTPGSLAITFDCGTDDFFYGVNIKLHEKLMERNIPHDFTVRPGVHNWAYWANSIQYQMLFFYNYFHQATK
ncbi:MAG: alpha/beta hydrolase family protein [Ginsengibacter sp.]